MKQGKKYIEQKLTIGNMVCDCCIRVLKMDLEQAGFEVKTIKLGEATVVYDPEKVNGQKIREVLHNNGFQWIVDNDKKLVEDIKRAVVDMVHYTTYNAMIRNSDYLIGKFGKTYQYLSSVFSDKEGITLEKYIIFNRIEKVKSLIQEGELTLSEIAFMMGYSSVQYLSTQFKNIAGVSVTDFKKDPVRYRKSIDKFL
ncbi:MAG TPA: AraC family transcriptional regulator [Bacteroidetes bacterium]|nr:AraC family transcriptional regulator [Bacteroidota bacterium]